MTRVFLITEYPIKSIRTEIAKALRFRSSKDYEAMVRTYLKNNPAEAKTLQERYFERLQQAMQQQTQYETEKR